MRRAEAAVYQAKRYGGDYIQFYEPAFGMRSRRIDLDTELRKALEAGSIDIVYQPIVRLEDNSIAGFEALTRWEHPLHGRIPPAEFIAAAEESGLIVPARPLRARARGARARLMAVGADRRAAALRLDQRVEPPAAPPRPHQRREGGARAHRRRARDAEARDHRVAGDAEPGICREGAARRSASSAPGWRSTISAPAIRRSPTCSTSPSTRSRSTGPSCGRTARRPARSCCARSSRWRTTSAWRSIAEGAETEAEVQELTEAGCEYAQGFVYGRPMTAQMVQQMVRRRPTAAVARAS